MISIKYLSIILSVIILFLVIELVREEKLTFKYAAGWIFACCVAIFFTLYDKILFSLSTRLGFELASNFIFFALLFLFVFLSLLLTLFVCQQDRRNETMAQKVGILEHELDKLKNKDRSI